MAGIQNAHIIRALCPSWKAMLARSRKKHHEKSDLSRIRPSCKYYQTQASGS